MGYNNVEHVEADEDLTSLHAHSEFAALVARMRGVHDDVVMSEATDDECEHVEEPKAEEDLETPIDTCAAPAVDAQAVDETPAASDETPAASEVSQVSKAVLQEIAAGVAGVAPAMNNLVTRMQELMQPVAVTPPDASQYTAELEHLHQMGFYDDAVNLDILVKKKGNLTETLDSLLA
eukprot:NODE_206_length_1211_cov_749.530981_g52_i1.p1 GENE.NODE_206_length_1211_cov_749.530981_g52_i1~~NODE_206_length_1211_cov_749.530981_g52_i1.p1  ORF type:complete len:178 (-),score=67.27 NODE_206_length_1211_cov_749.530981_g52_i1:287-820(-)